MQDKVRLGTQAASAFMTEVLVCCSGGECARAEPGVDLLGVSCLLPPSSICTPLAGLPANFSKKRWRGVAGIAQMTVIAAVFRRGGVSAGWHLLSLCHNVWEAVQFPKCR